MWNPFSIGKIVEGVASGADSLIQTFRGSTQERDQQSHDEFNTVQKSFAAEFNARTNRSWWDSLWDGFNRMPRPVTFLALVYYFQLAYADPAKFQILNVVLDSIPDRMWGMAFMILGFYFTLKHSQRMQETKGKLAQSDKEFAAMQGRIKALRSQPEAPQVEQLPPGYLTARSEMETGVQEIKGAEDNPRIVEYHKATSLKAGNDETAWCSAFVNWCMLTAGIARTDKANARSWLDWGVPLTEPQEGCVVVFKRGSEAWQGHVGFFVGFQGDQVLCLGGNQGNEINISGYSKSRVLGYRWAKT